MTSPAEAEAELLDHAREQLEELLGDAWRVFPSDLSDSLASPLSADRGVDAVWRLGSEESSSPSVLILIEVKRGPMTPARARQAVDQLRRYQAAASERLDGRSALMLVSTWLSPRTTELLEQEGVGYIDPTGNVSLRLSEPLVRIKTSGATRSPSPEQRPSRSLSGTRAGLLVRELVDFEPPRQATELVERTGLSQGYVSKLLDAMAAEALIERERDKPRRITAIDWAALLRSRASTYQLMRATHHVGAIARRGRAQFLTDLREQRNAVPVVMTGSYVVDQVAPTSIGGSLLVYVRPGEDNLRAATKSLGLLRLDASPNVRLSGSVDVMLLQAGDDAPFLRTRRLEDGIEAVSLSQLVLDCLSGPGRMPAEAEAVLDWMAVNTLTWRMPSPLS